MSIYMYMAATHSVPLRDRNGLLSYIEKYLHPIHHETNKYGLAVLFIHWVGNVSGGKW